MTIVTACSDSNSAPNTNSSTAPPISTGKATVESTKNEKGLMDSIYTIGHLQIYSTDLVWNNMRFFDPTQAKEAVRSLGNNWRLPSKDELMVIYENTEKLGEFRSNYYWGLNQVGDSGEINQFSRLNIVNGELIEDFFDINSVYCVRPVRSFY